MSKKSKRAKPGSGRLKKTRSIGPGGPPALQTMLQQALALHQAGQLPQAENFYRRILSVQPNHPEALCLLGMLAHQAGKDAIGVELISRALSVKPDYAEAHFNLGIVLDEQGKVEEAATSYRQALAIKPDLVDAHYNLALVLQSQGKLEEAATSYRQALELVPDFIEALNNLGVLFSRLGKMDEALVCFRKALAIRPDAAGTYKNLATLVTFAEVDGDVRAMESFFHKKEGMAEADRIELGFALGKVFGDLREYDKSFAFLREANDLKRRKIKYSIQEDHDLFARIKSVFSSDFFAGHQKIGFPDQTPIFILGMPRSGTTLVEQILASHPQVFGAGELGILSVLADSIGKVGRPFPEGMLDLDREALSSLGRNYSKRIRQYASDALRITDKMPDNFLRIGLIKVILPAAKVIHCQRDPMDNCFSIFKNDFSRPGTNKFAYDLTELGQYYNLYQDLMGHWQKTLPGFFYTLSYEDLVANQQQQTKGLLDFCGLPWDDACLVFHKTERKIETASLAQVRKPIYQDSVALWKRYEKQLEPLRRAIYDS